MSTLLKTAAAVANSSNANPSTTPAVYNSYSATTHNAHSAFPTYSSSAYVPKQYTTANYDYAPPTGGTADASAAASYLTAVPTPTVVRSPSVKPTAASSSSRQPEPSATPPRSAGQRTLPETPRTATATGTAPPPPIYANLDAGNSRNAAQVSRLLEEGSARLRSSQEQNGSSGNPPAIPRPAARLSLRAKVIIIWYKSKESSEKKFEILFNR
jgi:hypothetical protein